ncbi:hypothetical protein TIFTF001_050559 [Ficus carica]|uniref:Uncharacterized protein n=1 Tax=Ficus carica TaxID=3494 RepID=A0AA87ZKU3_FICCA|nr:hypothetical protein TIFTF001_050559 [Ficus carica]
MYASIVVNPDRQSSSGIQHRFQFALRVLLVQISGSVSPICSQVWRTASREISKFIDAYDVTLDVCLSSVFAQAHRLNQLQDTVKIDVCVEDETTKYLNRKDVQKAFHAELIGVTEWTICSE